MECQTVKMLCCVILSRHKAFKHKQPVQMLACSFPYKSFWQCYKFLVWKWKGCRLTICISSLQNCVSFPSGSTSRLCCLFSLALIPTASASKDSQTWQKWHLWESQEAQNFECLAYVNLLHTTTVFQFADHPSDSSFQILSVTKSEYQNVDNLLNCCYHLC